MRNFKLNKTEVWLNDVLSFDFDLLSTASTVQNLMVHYRIHYVKKSGVLSPKIFKLKEVKLKPGEKIRISKKQRFQDFTTRTHHSGTHMLDILVNGEVIHTKRFKFKR